MVRRRYLMQGMGCCDLGINLEGQSSCSQVTCPLTLFDAEGARSLLYQNAASIR